MVTSPLQVQPFAIISCEHNVVHATITWDLAGATLVLSMDLIKFFGIINHSIRAGVTITLIVEWFILCEIFNCDCVCIVIRMKLLLI